MKHITSLMTTLIALSVSIPAIVGCNASMPAIPGVTKAKNASIDPDARPDWINNPGNGVSASAGSHVKGKVAQEELAIQRAREEYAKRFGVTIESEQVSSQTVANGRANTVGQKVTHEETKQSDVKAQIKSKWRDPNSDTLWVWLIPSGN